MARGDLSALDSLLTDSAREAFLRLLGSRGPRDLSASLRRAGRSWLDCRIERTVALPSDATECRLRLFRLQPGGQIASCCCVVEAREMDGRWRIAAFDRLPGTEEG